MSIPPPFGSPPTLSMVPNTDFSDTLSKLGKVKGLANLNVMMIDLTAQPKRSVGRGTTGVFYGAPTRYIASCGKVAAMFAAFRLRKNFREAAARLVPPSRGAEGCAMRRPRAATPSGRG